MSEDETKINDEKNINKDNSYNNILNTNKNWNKDNDINMAIILKRIKYMQNKLKYSYDQLLDENDNNGNTYK